MGGGKKDVILMLCSHFSGDLSAQDVRLQLQSTVHGGPEGEICKV